MPFIRRGMLCDLKQACRNEIQHKWVALIGELPPPARDPVTASEEGGAKFEHAI
jgi:hypothetical protein